MITKYVLRDVADHSYFAGGEVIYYWVFNPQEAQMFDSIGDANTFREHRMHLWNTTVENVEIPDVAS